MLQMFKNIVVAALSLVGGLGLIFLVVGAIASQRPPAKVLTTKERERADCIAKWKIQEAVFTNGRGSGDWNDICSIEGH